MVVERQMEEAKLAIMSSPSSATRSNIFANGSYQTVLLTLEADQNSGPPKPLLIRTPSPTDGGDFPVLLLLHGYLLLNSFYSQLIEQVASHGFIAIAPQLYLCAGSDSSGEIKDAASITAWLAQGSLQKFLPRNVHPNLNKLALSGHSRGGKAAFALALAKVVPSALKISALIGISPVDGKCRGAQTTPPLITGESFDLDHMPVMVIGAEFGAEKKNCLCCPCAPKGVNHLDFYNACRGPVWYFVVKDYGHMDMLDDETPGLRGLTSYAICKNGNSREPMRRFVGGALVAFLKAYLEGDESNLIAIRDGKIDDMPVEFVRVDSR
ncbi:hypothetical protein Ancab_030337 [Ancistrocladus abbreviatus]